jgi:LemA protein
MAIPFRKSVGVKRQEKVRVLLGSERFRKKRWLHLLSRYIAEYYKVISITLLAVVCIYAHIYYYNKLITMEQQIGNLEAQIEAGLQMRNNVITNLTVAVNRYIVHEQGIFSSAMESRKDSLDVSNDLKKLIESAKEFSGSDFSAESLTRLMAVAENYPQLVSSQPYNELVKQIGNVETQIYNKRNEYNNAVNVYNTRLCTFPVNFFGKVMRFSIKPYYSWDKKAEWAFGEDNQNLDTKKQN